MLRFPKDFLTVREQRALLFVCVFGLAGMFLSHLGGKIPIIGKEEASTEQLADSLKADKIVQIDIRTASKEDLILLPGIGEKRAQDIIDYRNANPFTGLGDLLEIKGIGTKTLNKMLPMLLPFGDPNIPGIAGDGKGPDTSVSSLTENNSTAKETSSHKDSKSSKPASVPKSELTNVVNLNTAGLAELCTLPGIGEVKAQAIIDYRSMHGKFNSIEDIVKVKGIGAKTLEKIRARLSI